MLVEMTSELSSWILFNIQYSPYIVKIQIKLGRVSLQSLLNFTIWLSLLSWTHICEFPPAPLLFFLLLVNNIFSLLWGTGGSRKIPAIFYADGIEIPKRSRQLVWRAAVQMSRNASQLALQVSYFHLIICQALALTLFGLQACWPSEYFII